MTNELKEEDLLVYTDKIKDFSTVCACIMIVLIFAGSKEADKFVDIHEVRIYQVDTHGEVSVCYAS